MSGQKKRRLEAVKMRMMGREFKAARYLRTNIPPLFAKHRSKV